MAVADKLTTVLENVPKVYEAGSDAEHKAFWDTYTQNGTRASYRYGFAGTGWFDENFNPTETIYPEDARYMFQRTQITKLTPEQVDFSKTENMRDVFSGSTKLKTLEYVDASAATNTSGSLSNTFSGLTALTYLKLKVDAGNTLFTNTFTNCTALADLIIEDGSVIAKEAFNVQSSTNLTNESLKSIIWALKNYAGTSNEGAYTITLAEVHWTNLDAEGAPTDKNGDLTGYDTWKDYVSSLGWTAV